ncbi:MAG: hypothetical protein JW783_15965 [Bacteroidales bacterium]|nr:hypothetical protein [Bacteroidales bacterium]MBN2750634.1 hypothetical protein [Bacteroidales bacterium]
MRIGFFLDSEQDVPFFNAACTEMGVTMAGHTFHGAGSDAGFDGFTVATELLGNLDVAVVSVGSGCGIDTATRLLRKGIDLFITDISACSAYDLALLRDLAQEIGCLVGVNRPLGLARGLVVPLGKMFPLVADVRREIMWIPNERVFQEVLLSDLSAALLLNQGGIKKLRVAGMPYQSKTPVQLNLWVEFENASTMVYSLAHSCVQEKLGIRITFADGTVASADANHPFFSVSVDDDYRKAVCKQNLSAFVSHVETGKGAIFDLDKGIETLSLAEQVVNKLVSVL